MRGGVLAAAPVHVFPGRPVADADRGGARLLIRDRFDKLGKIAAIGAPLLILHGERDEIVPAAQARRLYAAAREPKTLTLVPNAGHNDLWGPEAAKAVLPFLRAVGR